MSGAGRHAGEDRGRALRPVQHAGGHRLRRAPVLERDGRREGRRHGPLPVGDDPRGRLLHVRRADRRDAVDDGDRDEVRDRGGDLAGAAADRHGPRRQGRRGACPRRTATTGRSRGGSRSRRSGSPRRSQPSGIDMKAGAMGTPSDIDRVGWFRDGAAPGDERGAVLLAGHKDSARRGAGAFYAIEQAPARDAGRGAHERRAHAPLPGRVGEADAQGEAPGQRLRPHGEGPARPRHLRRAVRPARAATTRTTSS